MAFDYGTKRIGIAVTDPMQIIATGLDTIHPLHIIDYLKKYLQTEQVERFIVGEPKQMDNTPSQSAIHVKGFVNLLKRTFPDIPIEMLDERFTSKMASATIAQSGMNKKNRQNKELVDTISATILLQSWMEIKRFEPWFVGFFDYLDHNSLIMEHKELTEKIIGCAMKVHRTLGNGFQEVIYQSHESFPIILRIKMYTKLHLLRIELS